MQSDTTRSKYPLNDPRNPDCPCHQYQRIADEEYRSGRSNTGSGNGSSQQVQHQQKRVPDNSGNSFRSEEIKKKRKAKFRRMNYFKKRSLSGYRGIKKFSLDSASCFRWQT